MNIGCDCLRSESRPSGGVMETFRGGSVAAEQRSPRWKPSLKPQPNKSLGLAEMELGPRGVGVWRRGPCPLAARSRSVTWLAPGEKVWRFSPLLVQWSNPLGSPGGAGTVCPGRRGWSVPAPSARLWLPLALRPLCVWAPVHGSCARNVGF